MSDEEKSNWTQRNMSQLQYEGQRHKTMDWVSQTWDALLLSIYTPNFSSDTYYRDVVQGRYPCKMQRVMLYLV